MRLLFKTLLHFSRSEDLTSFECPLVKNDPSVAGRFRALIARLSALSIQSVFMVWYSSQQALGSSCSVSERCTINRNPSLLHTLLAELCRCVKVLFAELVERYLHFFSLLINLQLAYQDFHNLGLWVLSLHTACTYWSDCMFTKSKVTAVTLLNRKMAVLLLLISSLLSYPDRHFASMLHTVELPICNRFFFPTKLIFFALCQVRMGKRFSPLAVCIFVIRFVLQVFVFSQVETKKRKWIQIWLLYDSYLCLNLISNKTKCLLVIPLTAIPFDFQLNSPGGDLLPFLILLFAGRLVNCSLQAVGHSEGNLWPLLLTDSLISRGPTVLCAASLRSWVLKAGLCSSILVVFLPPRVSWASYLRSVPVSALKRIKPQCIWKGRRFGALSDLM